MKILILGNGGREHAIAKKVSKCVGVSKIYVAPGNGGTALEFQNVALKLSPPYLELIDFVVENKIDLTIVGPETYLVGGVVDALENKGHKVFGPNRLGAEIEGSKKFAKEIMAAANVPSASYKVVTNYESALSVIESMEGPWVLKADGLAAGKGVIVAENRKTAIDSLDEYFVKKSFGDAGATLVIESFLKGQEASILAFTDGNVVRMLPPSQDHKRIFDGDKGPNTGGMGVYTPVKILTPGLLKEVEERVLLPTIKELAKRGIVYKGILYAGLMIDKDDIQVVEFNARFGDPETECVLPLLKTDLVKVMFACIEGTLSQIDFQLEEASSCTVILASGGYPGSYENGKVISGLDATSDVDICHAGTKYKDNQIITSGGRVLAVTAKAPRLSDAISKVYKELSKIKFEKMFFRSDIGKKGL